MWVLLIPPLWLLVGYLNDIPSNVRNDERPVNHLVSWLAVVVHVVGAVLVSTVSPLWALAWGAFAGLTLARRICARGYWANPLTLSDLVRSVRSLPYGWQTLAAAVVVALCSTIPAATLPGFLAPVQDLAGNAVGVAIVAVLAFAGWSHDKRTSLWRTRRSRAIDGVAAVFGVSPSVVADQARFTFGDDGGISIVPAPPALAAKLLDRAGVEERIASVMPHLTLEPTSTAAGIYLVPVDSAAQMRRDALASSGGLLAGVVDEPTDAKPTSLVLSPEDLR